MDAVKDAYKIAVPRVFFERGGEAKASKTMGPNIPTWAQVNAAKDSLSSVDKIIGMRLRWLPTSRLKWNLSAPLGSKEAHSPSPLRPKLTPSSSKNGRNLKKVRRLWMVRCGE